MRNALFKGVVVGSIALLASLSLVPSEVINPPTERRLESIVELNDDNWSKEVSNSNIPVVVNFYLADGSSGPCTLMKPIYLELSKVYSGKNIKFAKFSIDASAQNFELVPAFGFYSGGKCVGSIYGVVSYGELEFVMQEVFHLRKY